MIADDVTPREYAMFGSFGGHVNLTDGRYVYMRACAEASNQPLHEHTLMPTHMRGFFTAEELRDAELADPLPFTRGMPVLRTTVRPGPNPHLFGTLLFDLETDPDQTTPVLDDDVERRMAAALVEAMRANDAPPSQFARLGLPATGPVGPEHLLAAAQHDEALAGARAFTDVPGSESFPTGCFSVRSTMGELVADPTAAAVLRQHADDVRVGPFAPVAADATLYRAAPSLFGPRPWERLEALADDLARILSDDEHDHEPGRTTSTAAAGADSNL